MLARDVMTVGVITVAPDTPVKEIARLLIQKRIGGLPVVENGTLIGIVTSSDILALSRNAHVARDVMTPDPICLTEGVPVVEAARRLARHGIKRAPVVRGSTLVGIVTRSDLLRPYVRTDSEILAEIEDAVLLRALDVSPRDVHVIVDNGIVTLSGEVADEQQGALVRRLARAVDGVVDVVDTLLVRRDASVALRRERSRY